MCCMVKGILKIYAAKIFPVYKLLATRRHAKQVF